METLPLGRTGLTVSRIGLGLAALGRPGYLNLGHGTDLDGMREMKALESRAHEVLDAARSCGVEYYDTARSYGKAEAFLASWLLSRSVPGGAVTIGSKWGYTYTADWSVEAETHEVKDHTLGTLDRQVAESLELLGDHLGLYQIHSATIDSGVLGDPEVLNRLMALRTEGVSIGLTTSGTHQSDAIRTALDVTVDGRRLFDTVQTTWNLLEPSAGAALAEASEAGLGVIVKEALANGRLTTRDQAAIGLLLPNPEHTADALAIAAVLAQPWVDVVLSGATTADQLASNMTALTVDPAAIADLPDISEKPEDYWAHRTTMVWT